LLLPFVSGNGAGTKKKEKSWELLGLVASGSFHFAPHLKSVVRPGGRKTKVYAGFPNKHIPSGFSRAQKSPNFKNFVKKKRKVDSTGGKDGC